MRLLTAVVLVVATSLGFARAAPSTPAPASRATEFVVSVTTRDLLHARQGSQHVFAYAPEETEATLALAVRDWFAYGETRNLRLGPLDRLTLFAFHWAATQMPADSRCFSDVDSEDCDSELAYWLAQVRSGNPRFVAAYREAEMRLKLPPPVQR